MASLTAQEAFQLDKIFQAAPLLQAFLECDDALQEHAGKLVAALVDPELDADDRYMTALTLADILFPKLHEGLLGSDLEEGDVQSVESTTESRDVVTTMNADEVSFAERLRTAMTNKAVTQVELAEKLGVGQSAIAMMLQRDCRPQRRTVSRLAEALGIAPTDLWPGIEG